MGINAEQLEKEADAEFAQLMGNEPPAHKEPAPASQDKPALSPEPVGEIPPPVTDAQPEPLAHQEPSASGFEDGSADPVTPAETPAPDATRNDWQDKYLKAEESRKNAHALMTQATQKAADLERQVQALQQQLTQPVPAKADPQAQPPAASELDALREDYQELDPVFKTLEATAQQNEALQKRLAAIEQSRQQQEQAQVQEKFWSEVRRHHADVDQIAASSDFQGWFARQTPDVQQLSQVSPVGAITVMNLYKQAAGKAAPSKLQQAQALSEPQVRGRSQPTTQGRAPAMTLEQIAALPQKDFDANEEKYDKMLDQLMKQGGSL